MYKWWKKSIDLLEIKKKLVTSKKKGRELRSEMVHGDIMYIAASAAKSLLLCPTLCDPIDGSPPGCPVPGILQARTLEWVAISFSNAWKWKVKSLMLAMLYLLSWAVSTWICTNSFYLKFVVQSLSHVWLFVTPWTETHQVSLSFTLYWSLFKLMSIELVMPSYHLIPFSACLQSFPASRSFLWVSSLHQVARLVELQVQHQYFQWIFRVDFLQDWLVLSPCCPRDSQESSPTAQFESINPSAFSLLYGPTFTSIYDYWKNHSFDYMDLCQVLKVAGPLIPRWCSDKEPTYQCRRSKRLGLGRSPGAGNGNPLQCSCLGNLMDRGAWWAIFHGVIKGQTQLKQLSMHVGL